MGKRMTAVLVTGLLMATSAAAGDFSYNFVRLDYVNTEVDFGGADVDGNGPQLTGLVRVSDMFYLLGGIQSIDFDGGVDGTRIELGGGYKYSFRPRSDFVTTLSYVDWSLDAAGGGSADSNGLALSAGVRHWFTDEFEALGRLKYVDLDGSDTSIELRGDYFVTPHWVIGGGFEFGGDATSWLISGRYNFAGFRK
jgi:hypothetical protein